MDDPTSVAEALRQRISDLTRQLRKIEKEVKAHPANGGYYHVRLLTACRDYRRELADCLRQVDDVEPATDDAASRISPRQLRASRLASLLDTVDIQWQLGGCFIRTEITKIRSGERD